MNMLFISYSSHLSLSFNLYIYIPVHKKISSIIHAMILYPPLKLYYNGTKTLSYIPEVEGKKSESLLLQ